MMIKGNAREAALYILKKIDKNNAWADALISQTSSLFELDKRDTALCARIVYGILQNKYLLRYCVSLYCSQPVEKLQNDVRNILYIGAYQILFMDKIPVSAAVNESVEMAKRNHCTKASGLINAVLHKLVPFHKQMPNIQETGIRKLSIQYSLPEWLLEKVANERCIEDVESFAIACNQEVPTIIQVNTLKIDTKSLENTLRDENIEFSEHPWLPNCLEIHGFGNIENLESYRSGLFYIQDSSSKLVSLVIDNLQDKNILDVCAAPGGKTLAMAIEAENKCSIVSCDIYANKLANVKKQCNRLGISAVQIIVQNGKENVESWNDCKDIVLVDAPCSGFGIIRKKPDIRYKDPNTFLNLPNVQYDILNNSSKYVKKGGYLIYSTCTIFKDENENVVNRFLKNHVDFELKSFNLPLPIGVVNGFITLWPDVYQSDGFFICLMKRM